MKARQNSYLAPTQESGRALVMRGIAGNLVMLNLLKFRDVADYSASPELSPAEPISGKAAYRLYMEHTLPHLQASGGEVLFYGKGGHFLIGPMDELWDAVLLVKQHSIQSLFDFEKNEDYMSGMGHRTAALEDSRLLPLEKMDG